MAASKRSEPGGKRSGRGGAFLKRPPPTTSEVFQRFACPSCGAVGSSASDAQQLRHVHAVAINELSTRLVSGAPAADLLPVATLIAEISGRLQDFGESA